MSKDKRDSKTDALSRRKFLAHTATAGGVALVGATVAVSSAAQEGSKTAGNGAGVGPSATAKLMGEMIEYKSGDMKIPAYFSRSKKRGSLPGAVLVIHEVFGLNDHIKSIADRIANEGYAALAPNFFIRASVPPPKDTTDMAALRKAAGSIPAEVAI